MCQNTAGLVTNSVDPDQMPCFVASNLYLHFVQACLSQYFSKDIRYMYFGFDTGKILQKLAFIHVHSALNQVFFFPHQKVSSR